MVSKIRVLARNIDNATYLIAQVRSAHGARSSAAEQTCKSLAARPSAGLIAAGGGTLR